MALEGKFMIRRETARALEKDDELWGIQIDRSDAVWVYYPEGESEGEEEEEEEREDGSE